MNNWNSNEIRVAQITNGIHNAVTQLRQTLVGAPCKIYRGKYARHGAFVDALDVSLVDGELLVLVQLKIKRKSHPGFVDDKKYPKWQKHWYVWGVETK